jgi:hypothetical protein
MKVSDITLLGDGVYELEKGFNDWKLVNGDRKLVGDANVW